MSYDYTSSEKAFEKAAEAIKTAEFNLNHGFLGIIANRAYYASYYCMVALLNTKMVYSKTHAGVRSKFSEMFIKTSILPATLSTSIAALFDYRHVADYDLEKNITAD